MQDEKTNKNNDVPLDDLTGIRNSQAILSDMVLRAAAEASRLRFLFSHHQGQRHLMVAATLMEDVVDDLHDALRQVRRVVVRWYPNEDLPTVVVRKPR